MLVERIKKIMGWCPMAIEKERKEDLTPTTSFICELKLRGYRILFASIHLIIGLGLLASVFYVLKNMPWFPGWIMEIDIIASMLLFIIALISIFIAFDIIKSKESNKVLSIVNLAVISVLFAYLACFTVEKGPMSILWSLRLHYAFSMRSLILFTLIIATPSLVYLIRKGTYKLEKRTGIILAIILILTPAAFASLHYYINLQKSNLLIEKGEDYEIYSAVNYWGKQAVVFVDSDKWSSGVAVCQEEYDALKFLEGLEDGKVMAWWDFGLRIKALAKKEPVIYFASKEIKSTVARIANERYEPAEKVRDVAMFFTTDNEEEAKALMEKHEAVYVYFPKNRIHLFNAMEFASGLDVEYENSMFYRFENALELRYFEKIYENEYAVIYKLSA